MRRLLAVAAGALGLLLLPTTPASAAYSQATWTSPEGVTPPAQGADDWTAVVDQRTTPQTVNLAGVFDHPNGVANVSLVLEQAEYDQPPCAPTGFPASAPGAPQGATVFSFDVIVPCNGTYVVRAEAESRPTLTQPAERAVLRLQLAVAVPAVPAQALRAQSSGGDEPSVALSWEPVAEVDRDPDFAGYDVERSVGGADYEVIASLPDADASAFVDEAPDPSGGAHRYRVVSIRRAGAQEEDGVVAASDAAPEAEAELPRQAGADGAGGDGATDGGSSAEGGGQTRGGIVAGRAAAPNVRRTFRAPGRTTATTIDTGFGETLPFDPNAPEQALPQGDPAVVAQLEDDGVDTTKQTLALVAGGSALGVGALGVRRLLRKAAAANPYEILQ